MTHREVFAVPGHITSRNSFGMNFLIKGAGAKLIRSWQDVVEEFPPDMMRELVRQLPGRRYVRRL
jgi:DNA processing protein